MTRLLQQDYVGEQIAFERHPREADKWAYVEEAHSVSEGPGPRHGGWRSPDLSDNLDHMPVVIGRSHFMPDVEIVRFRQIWAHLPTFLDDVPKWVYVWPEGET